MKKTIGLACLMAGGLVAQTIPPPPPGARGGGPAAVVSELAIRLNGVNAQFVSGVMQGPLVKNAPYAAEAVTETTQKLFDGNQIVNKTTAKLYRDSEGRERREEGMGAVLITDPVEKVRLNIRPESKTATKQPYAVPQVFAVRTSGGEVQLTVGAGVGTGVGGGLGAGKGRGKGPGAIAPQNIKEEDLGTRIVEGVQAQGNRTTRTVAAGEIGNARDIEIVDERWYSPDLQLTVMTRHSDPREGETVFRLTNIQRIEQVRSLFEVPPGYTVNDQNAGRGSDVLNQGKGGGGRSAAKSK